ncbi:polysaccharide pyruvyl transferase family protein [Deinococcus lacus]|uniref:polysaccharide pyruvyl transferase family protein n=1 Tax=Deinococcus lacus TaxID=392561 RepID=UPI0036D2B354
MAPRGDVTESLPALQALVKALRAEGRRVLALALMPAQDGAAAEALGADEVLQSADPQQLLDAIAASDFVVGVRLHALILAAAAGVPFAGLSYDPKVSGFCTDCRAPALGVEPDPQELLRLVRSGGPPDWAAVAAMRARAEQSFDWVLGG